MDQEEDIEVLEAQDGTEASPQAQVAPQDVSEPQVEEQEAVPEVTEVEQEAVPEIPPQTLGAPQDVPGSHVEEQEAVSEEVLPQTQGTLQDVPESRVQEEAEVVSPQTQGAPQDASESRVEEEEAVSEVPPQTQVVPQDAPKPEQESVQLQEHVTTTRADCLVEIERDAEVVGGGDSDEVEVAFNLKVEVPIAPAAQEIAEAGGAPTEAQAAGQTKQMDIECTAIISPTRSPDAPAGARPDSPITAQLSIELKVASSTSLLGIDGAVKAIEDVSKVQTEGQMEDLRYRDEPPEIKIESQEDTTKQVPDEDKPSGGDLLHDDLFDLSHLETAAPSDAVANQDRCFHHPLVNNSYMAT